MKQQFLLSGISVLQWQYPEEVNQLNKEKNDVMDNRIIYIIYTNL